MSALLERLVFGHRHLVVAAFAVVTLFMAWMATGLRIDAGFTKLLPLEHEYMKTFMEYRRDFGGANRVLIALRNTEGDIFEPDFLRKLADVTDEVFFIPGVDRTRVFSLFTPNVRYTEVVEDGIRAGNVVPADFAFTAEGAEDVRENVLKSNVIGRLVANDFSAAIVSAQLLEFDPNTGERLDYTEVSRMLEERIREPYADDPSVTVHIIGFAKIIGDIAQGAGRVVVFFAVSFLITAVLFYLYAQSLPFTLVAIGCSLVAVIWQLGLLTLLGYGIDPMSLLVPFLVFAIAVSHGVQMVSAVRAEVYLGAGDSLEAARRSFRRLLVPGGIALVSDTIGFVTILLIAIAIIREMAITASLGVATIILTNLVLLPVLLSWVPTGESYRQRLEGRVQVLAPLWDVVFRAAKPRPAAAVIAICAVLIGVGAWKATQVRIGDLHAGVPELRTDSRYNRDARFITAHFAIGVDMISVIVEAPPDGCIDYEIMDSIDWFAWHMRNTEGVQSVNDLPAVAKDVNAGWNEGSLLWHVLPRNSSALAQSVTYVPTSTGLLNSDCSAMPVQIFTRDHRAATIDRVIDRVKRWRAGHGEENLRFRLAAGNVGVMAATNEAVQSAQFPMLAWLFAAIIALCLVTFRSLSGTLCIVVPLASVSLLAYALMAVLEIGLKVNTLPVVALGVGIGVDYGIYIFSRLQSFLRDEPSLARAYRDTLAASGTGVVFTGVTLAIGVATWIFAPLKFQADMGILLTFMFLVNMLGAIVLLPALATWLLPRGRRDAD